MLCYPQSKQAPPPPPRGLSWLCLHCCIPVPQLQLGRRADIHVTVLCFPCLLSFCRAAECELSCLRFPLLPVPRDEEAGFGTPRRRPLLQWLVGRLGRICTDSQEKKGLGPFFTVQSDSVCRQRSSFRLCLAQVCELGSDFEVLQPSVMPEAKHCQEK